MIFNESGGTSLNFKVVKNPRPKNPSQNTIWINTEEMAGWHFQSTQPEDAEDGAVWISIGTISMIAFNALKKNVAMMYPITVKQLNGGVWESKNAEIYQDNEWKPFYGGYLGDFANNLGDPSFVVLASGGNCTLSTKTFTPNEDGSFNVEMKNAGSGVDSWINAACCFPKKLDLKNVNTISITYIVEDYKIPASSLSVDLRLHEAPTSGASLAVQTIVSNTTAKNTLITKKIDVSGVDEGYLRIYHNFASMNLGGSSFKIKIIDINPGYERDSSDRAELEAAYNYLLNGGIA